MSEHDHSPRLKDSFVTRREFLQRCGMGMGMLGLGGMTSLMASESYANPLGITQSTPLAPKAPHFAPTAKRVVHLFMNGGPSHVDTFDPKPRLSEFHGKPLPIDNLKTERKTGAAFGSPFAFKQYGQSGIPISEIFPHVAESADELCVIRSMHADVPNHEPSLMLMNCGTAQQIRPAVGSWVTYGLGSENQNLPGFITMCPGGYPIQETQNWQSGFLPGVFAGTYVDTRHQDIEKLIAHIKNEYLLPKNQRVQLYLLQQLNPQHQEKRQADSQLESRIQSFELAYRMQMDATDAFDINRENETMRAMYGDNVWGRQMLITRRLLEKGVRYIQVWHGEGQPWDSHDDIEVNHRRLAGECDQAIGALLKDLKQSGMLDDTLVIWGGEFGRTPAVELPQAGANAGKINGRDHNNHGFTMWMAGGGVKRGHIHGATDEFGFKSVENRVHIHDLHATILHLLGFDHERLTYRYAGRDFRLTDVFGNVVKDIIA